MTIWRGHCPHQPVWEKWPTTVRVYMPGGHLAKAGELFVQADLARTFQSLAEVERQNAGQGRAAALEAVRDYFYRGPIAKRISDFCKQAGCLLREGDFAAYQARVEEPLRQLIGASRFTRWASGASRRSFSRTSTSWRDLISSRWATTQRITFIPSSRR